MSDTLLSLYAYADSKKINIYHYPLQAITSISFPENTGYIAMNTDKLKTYADETVHLAHELGHIETNSFYTVHSKFALRNKMEARADSWAIRHLIPWEKLKQAVGSSPELWELAEDFGVTNEFMLKALNYYKRKGKL
jgi:Zn-dependent peptidase ImmA (M78 family)